MAVKKATTKAKAATKKAPAKKAITKVKPATKKAPAKTPAKAPIKKATGATKAAGKKAVAKKDVAKKAVAKDVAKKDVAKKVAPAKEIGPSKKVSPSKQVASAQSQPPAAAAAVPAKPAPKTLGQKRPEAPRPTTAGLDKAFLDEQRAELLSLRKEYIAQAEEYEAEADLLAQELETGDVGFDEEAGEGGAATVDRERNLLLAAQARQTATEIDEAVKRIAKGRYGLCLHCGQKIPKMRLKAIPHAELCVDCKAGGLLRRR